ncbi:MAG: hypothetical protein E7241_11530 [Lachnospiraceae bacterium]|nr:hypothetical protein [Lachnospiraceae bacterium]
MMKTTISESFKLVGVPVNSRGYRYIKDAVRILKERREDFLSFTKELYPSIAKIYGTSPYGVERAIRYAICKFWENCRERVEEDNILLQGFESGKRPSNAQFITYLFELVRSEEERD